MIVKQKDGGEYYDTTSLHNVQWRTAMPKRNPYENAIAAFNALALHPVEMPVFCDGRKFGTQIWEPIGDCKVGYDYGIVEIKTFGQIRRPDNEVVSCYPVAEVNKWMAVPAKPLELDGGRQLYIREWKPIVTDDVLRVVINGFILGPLHHKVLQ